MPSNSAQLKFMSKLYVTKLYLKNFFIPMHQHMHFSLTIKVTVTLFSPLFINIYKSVFSQQRVTTTSIFLILWHFHLKKIVNLYKKVPLYSDQPIKASHELVIQLHLTSFPFFSSLFCSVNLPNNPTIPRNGTYNKLIWQFVP